MFEYFLYLGVIPLIIFTAYTFITDLYDTDVEFDEDEF